MPLAEVDSHGRGWGNLALGRLSGWGFYGGWGIDGQVRFLAWLAFLPPTPGLALSFAISGTGTCFAVDGHGLAYESEKRGLEGLSGTLSGPKGPWHPSEQVSAAFSYLIAFRL